MKDWKKNVSPKTSIVHKNKIRNKKIKGIFLNIRDINTVLMIESMKAIIKYWIKYDIKYVPSPRPIIFIPSFDLFSFSPTILKTYKHKGHIYAMTIKKGIMYPMTPLNGSDLESI
jgi:hypothetical protein